MRLVCRHGCTLARVDDSLGPVIASGIRRVTLLDGTTATAEFTAELVAGAHPPYLFTGCQHTEPDPWPIADVLRLWNSDPRPRRVVVDMHHGLLK